MTDSSQSDDHRVDDMQRLRDIVLGHEKQRLHDLDKRVSDLESRTADVAEVLPAAMARLVADPASLPEIERPVVKTIHGAIKRDTETFAEALFPVLGPAIRRAVSDALKGMVQRINVALENSFTIKGLKWRLESARTGVPFAQIVLRHTMLYAVQEAFLIQRDSGLILASVHRDEQLALEEDAVAAMLTAIQSFIQDSFGLSDDEPLRSAELGDRTLWVINGPAAALACVISGTPPNPVRGELMLLLETLHSRYGQRFDGNHEELARDRGVQALMHEALREEADENVNRKTRYKYRVLWIVALLLLFLYLAFSSLNAWRERQFARQVTDDFKDTPGYVVTSSTMKDGILKIAGLRDPMAQQPAIVLSSHDSAPSRVDLDFSPYQSLEPALVLQRLGQRFEFDSSTSLQLTGDTLIVSGSLDPHQMTGLSRLPDYHPLIRHIDFSAVRLGADAAGAAYREALQAPDTVRFEPLENVMEVTGTAAPGWYTSAREAAVEVAGWNLDFTPLETHLSARLGTTIESLDKRALRFTDGNLLHTESLNTLDELAAELVVAQALAEALGERLEVTLEGSADGIGSREQNIEVSNDRSSYLRKELVARGVADNTIRQTIAPWQEGDMDPERRTVTLMLARTR